MNPRISLVDWVIMLCMLVPSVSFGQSFADSTLAIDWYVLQFQNDTLDAKYPRGSDNHLTIRPNGTFTLRLPKDSIIQDGYWEIIEDSLVLRYDLLPAKASIDSITYAVYNGNPILSLFSEENELATYDPNRGLNSARVSKAYKIDSLENGLFRLTRTSEMILMVGSAPLLKSAFHISDILRGILGLSVMLLIAWVFSVNRGAIDWRLVGTGMGLQLTIALLVLKVPLVGKAIQFVADGFVVSLGYSQAGAKFIFGELATNGALGYFAFQILPTIVFFSALMAVLYYLGVLQRVVYAFAWIMSKTMRLSGAESLAAAGNIFVGQTEAPLLVRPYLDRMTKSEIMALMTGGFATIAGGVFAAYIQYLGGDDPAQQADFARHLLTASVMSAPAALVVAKILIPETEEVNRDLTIPKDKVGANLLDALSIGIRDGLKLAVNVGVMLMVFTAIIALLNGILGGWLGSWTGLNDWVFEMTEGRYGEFNLQFILGLIGAPIAWLLGVPADDILIIGQLLGEKTILNEFFAYGTLGQVKSAGGITHYKSVVIATYALCGFANFASIGIQIGGIGALAPSRRVLLSQLGMRALLGGTLAAFLTAAIAGMLMFL